MSSLFTPESITKPQAFKLRDYQQAAVDSTWQWFRDNQFGNPVIIAPTGAGKTLIIAELVRHASEKWHQRVLIVTHQKELVEQNYEKLTAYAPDLDVGINSAGLRRRDKNNHIIVASIQSLVPNKKVGSRYLQEIVDAGEVNMVLVDEAHMITSQGEGRYRQLFTTLKEMCPRMRVIGLTATPYREKGGCIFGEEGELLFDDMCFEIEVDLLINEGYIARPVCKRPGDSKHADLTVSMDGVKTIAGDFDKKGMAEAFIDNVEQSTLAMIDYCKDFSSVLVFTCNIAHATKVKELLEEHGESAEVLHSQLEDKTTRPKIIEDFKAGRLKYLVNCMILTTGFDAPNCEAVVLMRATKSTSLYVQMVGRGFRKAPGKDKFYLLDFGGNVQRHGAINAINPRDIGVRESTWTCEEPIDWNGGQASCNTINRCTQVTRTSQGEKLAWEDVEFCAECDKPRNSWWTCKAEDQHGNTCGHKNHGYNILMDRDGKIFDKKRITNCEKCGSERPMNDEGDPPPPPVDSDVQEGDIVVDVKRERFDVLRVSYSYSQSKSGNWMIVCDYIDNPLIGSGNRLYLVPNAGAHAMRRFALWHSRTFGWERSIPMTKDNVVDLEEVYRRIEAEEINEPITVYTRLNNGDRFPQIIKMEYSDQKPIFL